MSDAEYQVNKVARDTMFLRYKRAANDVFAPPLEAVKAECETARESGGEAAYDATLARHVEQQEEIERLSGRVERLFPSIKAGDQEHTEIMDRFTAAHEKGGHDGLRQAYLDVIAGAEAKHAENAKRRPFYQRIEAAGGQIRAAISMAGDAAHKAKWARRESGASAAEQEAAYDVAFLAALPEVTAIFEAAKAREVKAEKVRVKANRLLDWIEGLGGNRSASVKAAEAAGLRATDPIIEAGRAAMLGAAGVKDVPASVLTAPGEIFDEVFRRACTPLNLDADVFEATADDSTKRVRDGRASEIRAHQATRSRGNVSLAYFKAALGVVSAEAYRLVGMAIAAVPVGLLLVYLCYVFADAAKDEHFPAWYVWIALIGSGVGLAALTRKSAPSLVWLGLGLPVWAIALAVLMIVAPSPFILFLFLAALPVLIIYPDKWAREVAGLMWKNFTQHQDLPTTYSPLGYNNFRRMRVRLLFTALWLLLVGFVILVALVVGSGLGGPVIGSAAAFFAFMGMFTLTTGAGLFKGGKGGSGIGFFTVLNASTFYDVRGEGPARMVQVIRNGERVWVPMGRPDAGAGVVFADMPSSGEPARPGYVKKFDQATGRYEWVQTLEGDPNIKTNVEPLRPNKQFGDGRFVSEPD